ncbi:unnamed protein product, partial [Mesorhabditis spiculigera]
MADQKSDFIERAKLAEQAERYEDMAKVMKEVVELGEELELESRNLFSVAYKNVVGTRRSAWRTLVTIKENQQDLVSNHRLTDEYRTQVEQELRDSCNETISLLENYLIPKAQSADSKVFYIKMRGDYFRYLGEILLGDDRKALVEKAEQAYNEAFVIAKENMVPTHPIRLGLALNFSVFYYELAGNQQKACKMAREAFDEAVKGLDSLNEDSYKDSTLIMQLLRDNLTLWGTEALDESQPDD